MAFAVANIFGLEQAQNKGKEIGTEPLKIELQFTVDPPMIRKHENRFFWGTII